MKDHQISENYPYPWTLLDWEDFEELCMELASIIYQTDIIGRYRKRGQKQHGLDIYAFTLPTNEFLCIQCKHVEKFEEYELHSVVNEFKEEKQYEKADIFIVATNQDVKSLDELIITYRQQFKLSNKRFICWGLHNLVKKLKNHYDVVLQYFGKQYADEFCHRGGIRKKSLEYKRIEDYLNTNISPLRKDLMPSTPEMIYGPTSISLSDIFKDSKKSVKKICIIGNPHEGKTTMLKQFAYEASTEENSKFVLFINLNQHSNISVEEMLSAKHGEWKSVPAKALIVILDGLDEVQTEEFQKTLGRILEFTLSNELISIIVSVRNIFFQTYSIAMVLEGFSIYEIQPPTYEERYKFINNTLGSKKTEDFQKYIISHDLASMISSPFMLVEMVHLFKSSPSKLPENKGAFLEHLIKKSFEISKTRKTIGGIPFHENYTQYTKLIVKFAFVNQLMGSNGLSGREIQELYTLEERTLLKHSSIIDIFNDRWMFINAYYQEHLAGYALFSFTFEQIRQFSTVGNHYLKIKIKWIQTIASFLSLSHPNDKKRLELITLIENDNLELLTNADGSVFDNLFLSEILSRILDRYKNLKENASFQVVNNKTIALFIKSCTEKVQILRSYLIPSNNITVKYKCWDLLSYLEIEQSEKSEFEQIALVEITNTDDIYYAKTILQFLKSNRFGNRHVIDLAISNDKLVQHHDFRDGIYSLVTTLKLYDEYFQFALDGIEILIAHNKNVSHTYSEDNLLALFLQTENVKNIKLILKAIADSSWKGFVAYNSNYRTDFKKPFFSKIAKIANKEPSLIIHVMSYLRSSGIHALGKDEIEALNFLKSTDAAFIPLRINLQKYGRHINFETSAFLEEKLISYLLYEFEEDMLDISALKKLIFGLQYIGNDELNSYFTQALNDATENGAFVEERTFLKNKIEFEILKSSNDLQYLKSKTSFKKAIQSFFTTLKGGEVSEDDLYDELNGKSILRSTASAFMRKLFMRMRQKGRKLTLKNSLEILDINDSYEWLRAEFIHQDKPFTPEIFARNGMSILKDHYNKYINTADFRSIREDGHTTTYNYKEGLLADLFKAYEFPTSLEIKSKMIWFDRDWHLDFSKSAKICLSQKIIDGLNENEKEIFSQTIVENLKEGIKVKTVLQNHVDICRYLKIREASPFLLDLINNTSWSELLIVRCLDAYLQIDGNKRKLMPKLQAISDFNSHLFFTFVAKLFFNLRVEMTPLLIECINSETVNIEFKISAAQYLAAAGETVGFDYIVDHILQTRGYRFRFNSHLNITNISTKYGLSKLHPKMHLLLEKDKWEEEIGYDDLRSTIIQLLENFAQKSEEDLIQVEELLKLCAETYSEIYNNSSYFLWQAERIVDSFRKQITDNLNINSVTDICRSVNWNYPD